MIELFFNEALLASTLRLTTPILLACLAGLFAERSGIFDIGLEGKLLVAAFLSASVAAVTGSAWLGAFAGMGISVGFALIHGFASITLGGNQLIAGVALNFLASGLTALLGNAWFRAGGSTPPLSNSERFLDVPPFGFPIWVYVAFLMVPVTWYVVYRTRFGLRLRAVGENPAAVDTAGISVVRMRYSAMIITGLICGMGGVYLSNGIQASFGREMSAGMGYMALAALIFAKWRPWQAMGACLLFGYLRAFSIRNASYEFPVIGQIPSQFMDALPYVLTIIVLAGFIGRAIAPKAGGVPYLKESR